MRLQRWTISFLHGILLLIFSWIWISMYASYGDEAVLIKWSSAIKRTVFGLDEDPPAKDFLFINLAYDKELVASEETLGKELITDRAALAKFFHILKANPNSFRFAFCDVFLAGDSGNDSLLTHSLSGLNNIVFPVHVDETDSITLPKFHTRYAIADYRQTNDMFMKFRLVQDERLPSVPVYMHSILDSGNITAHRFYNTDNGRLVFNNIVVDFPIRSYELFQQQEYPVINLAELLILPPEILVKQYLEGRILVLGDFKGDTHNTIYGKTPGALILLNSYLALKNGYHKVSWVWLLGILVFFTLASYKLLYGRIHEEKKTGLLLRYSFMASLLNYLVLFAAVSVISYILFNLYINILILAVYFNCLAFAIDLAQKRRKIPGWQDIFTNIKDTYFNFK